MRRLEDCGASRWPSGPHRAGAWPSRARPRRHFGLAEFFWKTSSLLKWCLPILPFFSRAGEPGAPRCGTSVMSKYLVHDLQG